jgi:ssDNA-binding Zn-finger/Zn-ribbon topoisomerase 1
LKYNKTHLHCPECGKQTVYVENSEGDYYEGPTNLCVSCDSNFTLPHIGVSGMHKKDLDDLRLAEYRHLMLKFTRWLKDQDDVPETIKIKSDILIYANFVPPFVADEFKSYIERYEKEIEKDDNN